MIADIIIAAAGIIIGGLIVAYLLAGPAVDAAQRSAQADDPMFTREVWKQAVANGLTTEGYDEYLKNRGRR